jgi:uncharacterized protein YjaG (DUF416 family)
VFDFPIVMIIWKIYRFINANSGKGVDVVVVLKNTTTEADVGDIDL